MPVENKKLIYEVVKLSDIKPSKFNTRKLSDNDPTLQSLVESMRQNGQLVPVIVRPLDKGKYKYELLAGVRRMAAARLLNRGGLNAEIVDVDDEQAMIIITTENLQRENLTPFEEAESLKLLLDKNPDVKAIASNLGRSPQWVARRARLLDLTPGWREAANKVFSNWSVGHFELIARYSAEMQGALLIGIQEGWQYNISVAELERILNKDMRLVKKAPWNIDDDSLVPEAGSCTSCTRRSCRQPELFEDDLAEDKVIANDKCLDMACWNNKTKAYVERMIARHKERHPNIIQIATDYQYSGDGILHPSGYNNAKKKDVGSKPAVVVAGPGIGEIRWIKLLDTGQKTKPARAKDKDGKPVPPSTDERLEKLKNRRNAWIVKKTQELLPKSKFTGSLYYLVSLTVVFGTQYRNDYFDKGDWKKFTKLSHGDSETSMKLVDSLWAKVAGVFISRFNYQTAEDATSRIPEVKSLCELIDVDLTDLEKQAESNIPMSKVLADQIKAEELEKLKQANKHTEVKPEKSKEEKPKKKRRVKRKSLLK